MPAERAMRIASVSDRASAYGMPGEAVDGNDVAAVHAVAERAVARARAGEGPTLIEARSYRISPHSAATPGDSRPVAELDAWRARDPILRLGTHLVDGGMSEAAIEALTEQAAREVADAAEWALACDLPSGDSALMDVYAPAPWNTDGRLA